MANYVLSAKRMRDSHHMHQIPESVLSVLSDLTGDSSGAIEESFQQPVGTSVRVNRKKLHGELNLEHVSWCDSGYFLPHRPNFALDPLFHAGAYYVQEASSMFLEEVLKQHIPLNEPLAVLDLCAAPGGKSTHLLSLISDESLLVSNEVIRARANILSENLTKWGYPNQAVISRDPSVIGNSGIHFDLVVVDAPCSGEGLFRRDNEAINHWSEENVQLCSLRQRRILADIWPALKPGGWLIYSTCTFNKLENEENLKWLSEQFDAECLRLQLNDDRILETEEGNYFCYRFLPNRVNSEGFFISIFKKNGERITDTFQQNSSKRNKIDLPPDLLQLNENVTPQKMGDSIRVLPAGWTNFLNQLEKLRPISIGTTVGEWKGKDFRPDQALANSVLISERIAQIELDHDEALDFLSRTELRRSETPGWKLMTFDHVALGFAKSIGNRLNNNFRKEWRLRLDHRQRKGEIFSIHSFFN
ncbi:MAG: rRNA methyltransferase [Flavobacteriales bacterium]|nr:rRNA methyltransferase [Flavobacteriales bacterium]